MLEMYNLVLDFNSEAREWRHDSDKTRTNKLEWLVISEISLRAKAVVSKTLVKRKLRLHFLYFPQNTLLWTESSGEFSDLHSIFKLSALRYSFNNTIKPVLYCYDIIQYLNLVQHGLLSCDNNFFSLWSFRPFTFLYSFM